MRNIPSRPNKVNRLSRALRRRLESSVHCPWCDGAMYLNRHGDQLQCVDSIHCAGVRPVDVSMLKAVLDYMKEVA